MKNNIVVLIAGIVIGVTGFIGWQLYKSLDVISKDHTTLAQVVDFLNRAQQNSVPVTK